MPDMIRPDTIYALATPAGEGGVAVIRISGPAALQIMKGCFPRIRNIQPRRVYVGRVCREDMSPIDEAVVFYMAAPKSYTREDVVEIQCHGGLICARRVMERIAELGARTAEPGEFTRRAFENGRISLDQAEAVMELIAAKSQAAARAALRQMENGGGMSKIRRRVIELLSDISAADDFPEEVEDPVLRSDLEDGMREIIASLRRASDPRSARMARDGAIVALSGCPNVGKSSLMNAILGCERAIVDSEAGTTRDVLSERVTTDGRLFTLMDTAGQRQNAGRVEMAGIVRALEAEKNADAVVAVLDLSREMTNDDLELLSRRDERFLIVENKSDLPAAREPVEGAFLVSAKKGDGVDALLRAILDKTQVSNTEEVLTAPRQLELAGRAAAEVEHALENMLMGDPADLAAIPLWEAARLLGEITGEEASEAVIEAVFERFCVGK